MTMAAGVEVYNVDAGTVVARGRQHTGQQRDAALDGPVRELVEDTSGKRLAADLTASLSLTGFGQQQLQAVLNNTSALQDWRVGEAYGECYLVAHRACRFPWSDRWDERKDKSSLPGADLVGLQETTHGSMPFRFAFGEVKTSYDPQNPPGVMYGPEGLKKQMDDLRDQKSIRDTLVRYLMIRAKDASWEIAWKSAASRYFAANTDVAIFGVLIRDVAPDPKDLRARAKAVGTSVPPQMHIELLAIYLPTGSIQKFADFFAMPTPAKTPPPQTKKKKGG